MINKLVKVLSLASKLLGPIVKAKAKPYRVELEYSSMNVKLVGVCWAKNHTDITTALTTKIPTINVQRLTDDGVI